MLDSISGPSLGYGFFDTPFKLLILGDYHSTSKKNSLFEFLEKASQKNVIDVYIEDAEFVGSTTDLVNTFKSQRDSKCNEHGCSPWQSREMEAQVQAGGKNTLRGAIEFLFMCGRDHRICPLKRGTVHRVDLRPRLLVKKANGTVVQMIDDRTFKITPHSFVSCMELFVTNKNPQYICIQTGLSFAVIKRACTLIRELWETQPDMYKTLTEWWLHMIRNEYPPWIRVSKSFSREYNNAWHHYQKEPDQRQNLLHLVTTNCLMDIACIATMLKNECTSKGKFGVVYAGCAHAECIADFFQLFGPCEEAIENEYKLQPIRKEVHFPSKKLSSTFLK